MNSDQLQHVYVVNPVGINVISSVLLPAVSVTNFPVVQLVSVTNSCISICEPVDVNILNPCVSVCEPVDINIISSIALPIDDSQPLDRNGAVLFASSFVHGDNNLYWDTGLTGAGTSADIANEAAVSLNTTTASGDKVIKQSRQRIFYTIGRGRRVITCALLGAKKTNVRKRIGIFDADDGMFFEQTGTALNIVTRTFATGVPVDTVVSQASWNIDPFDGTGPSGLTLDETKIQVFVIDYDWQGAGLIKFGFRLDGKVLYAHQITNTNSLTLPYASTPTLPVRAEIENTDVTASSTTMKFYSASVVNNSGREPEGIAHGVDLGTSGKTVTGTLTPLIAIRLKSAFKKTILGVQKVNVFNSTGATVRWEIVFNPATLTGAAYSSVAANSIAEYDTAATAITGGTTLASGYTDNFITEFLQPDTLLKLSSNIAGTADVLVLAAQKTAGANPNLFANLVDEEFF